MYLKRISILNFKNIGEAKIEFSPKLNCITGINGSGKSNLLDAVYYLSMSKSYFSNIDQYTINYGESMAAIHGDYSREDGTEEKISLSLTSEGEKSIKRNGKTYQRFSDHIGLIPIVMVSPYDTCLINESGEERRRFLNAILSQTDREYLRRVQNYNQLLAQRNKLLKNSSISSDLLSAFSEQLSYNAAYIYQARKEFVNSLVPLVSKYYSMLSGGREEISIEYKSDLEEGPLSELLIKSMERDKTFKYTTTGVHRDDLLFNMNGNPIRKVGSQGQQKSFLISLKLAQFSIFKELHNKVPVLLLDDVFDKLDMQRVEYLLKLVASNFFGQIFITDSNKVRIHSILETINGETRSFEIEAGKII
ncbi:MAG: DNA replication/repair protein RecF [Bacteroidales bacterium]|nr:DNA replication/repair protein RecF [Bacteroidales bacterium]MDD2280390.1 DNA replication/repair protein RecF [Bacteroidales bacterium]MDD4292375.1 DNA replication/repair protein RecF [Bacteroidales bacterium]MDD4491377.1 DNA replication/repair protein RecF [Bacteroidales bacterium]HNW48920.1 DNA replication/repair protein RecF [Bacteroidales bacterium]